MIASSFQGGLPAPIHCPSSSNLQQVDAGGNARPVVAEAGESHGSGPEPEEVSATAEGGSPAREQSRLPADADQQRDAGAQQQEDPSKIPDGKTEKKLPRILWSNQSLSMVEPEVIKALRGGNKPPVIFQSGGKLVRPQRGRYGVYLEPLAPVAMR